MGLATTSWPRSRRSGRPAPRLDRDHAAGLQRLRDDPSAFLREWLGADLWDKQAAVAEAVRDHRRTAVKSCHASGKSFLAARLVLWFLHAYPSSVVLTTAPTDRQVRNILWRNINAAAAAAPWQLLGRCLQIRYEIAPDWYALGFKAKDTTTDAFQGFHAEHALVVIDEAAGVPDTVYEALDAVMTSEQARMLLIGNPTNPSGTFYDAFHGTRSLYHTITIAAHDTPNIAARQTIRPYLITQQWIDDAIETHGPDSPYVISRVDAKFPPLSDDSLIALAWIEAARNREDSPVDESVPVVAGLDVARMGGDENALCIRRGQQIVAQHRWTGLDTMETVGKTRGILADYPKLDALNIDVIGIGAGVADRLMELKYPVVEINVAAKSSDPEKWSNLRDELWWHLRTRFKDGEIWGEMDETTVGQLASVKYGYDSRHTHPRIESKEQAKKRGIKSPDRAEAVLLAFANIATPDFAPIDNDLAGFFRRHGLAG